ncbi:helix-turn-helix domain-containing protein [Lactococcus laudensis]|uniref:helix-turn-helix domain-containing protein n=1 Tax=Bacteria TaxID=2 RepID=UPI0039F1FF66
MTTLERIKLLAKKQGKSLQKVSSDLGFGVNYFYRLKTQQPTAEKLTLIADYFHVSVDYLLGRSNFKNYSDINSKVESISNSTEEFFDLVEVLNAETPDNVKQQDLKDFTVLNSFVNFATDYKNISSNKRWHIGNGITLLYYAIHELDDNDIEKLGEMLKAFHNFLISTRGFSDDEDDKALQSLSKTSPFEELVNLEKMMINFIDK